jgi:hypothetical protein
MVVGIAVSATITLALSHWTLATLATLAQPTESSALQVQLSEGE